MATITLTASLHGTLHAYSEGYNHSMAAWGNTKTIAAPLNTWLYFTIIPDDGYTYDYIEDETANAKYYREDIVDDEFRILVDGDRSFSVEFYKKPSSGGSGGNSGGGGSSSDFDGEYYINIVDITAQSFVIKTDDIGVKALVEFDVYKGNNRVFSDSMITSISGEGDYKVTGLSPETRYRVV